MDSSLIAPCGMNCNLCSAFLRGKNERNHCPGCRLMEKSENKYIRQCIIRNCETLKDKDMKYCSCKCQVYPCKRLKGLDKRYRTRYNMSMIDNLEFIEKKGIRKFLANEKNRWVKGNKVYCVHTKKYQSY